jgi:hypothetical protein
MLLSARHGAGNITIVTSVGQEHKQRATNRHIIATSGSEPDEAMMAQTCSLKACYDIAYAKPRLRMGIYEACCWFLPMTGLVRAGYKTDHDPRARATSAGHGLTDDVQTSL